MGFQPQPPRHLINSSRHHIFILYYWLFWGGPFETTSKQTACPATSVLHFWARDLSYTNPRNDRLVEVPRSMPLLFRRDKTKKVNNQMFVMIWQKNIFQSWSQFCCGKVSFWSSEFDDWIWDLKLSKFIHSFEIILLNHKIRFQLFLDLRWIRFEWIQHFIQL